MCFEALKQRLAVHLCIRQTTTAIDNCIARTTLLNKDSALFSMFPFAPVPGKSTAQLEAELVARLSSAGTESPQLLVLYSVSGIVDETDSTVFVLDATTREQFRLNMEMERPMTFLLVWGVHDPSGGAATPAALSSIEQAVEMQRVDCTPTAALLSNYKGMIQLLTRPSASLEHAKQILQALDHGSSSVDADSALTDCCLWVQDTCDLLDKEFARQLSCSDTALHVVEAFQKRYTAIHGAVHAVQDPNSPFQQLLTRYVNLHSSEVAQQWQQRYAKLTSLQREYRIAALAASLLSKASLTLKFSDPVRDQNTTSLESLTIPVCVLLSLAALLDHACRLRGEGQQDSVFATAIRQRFVPLYASAAMSRCASLIAFQTIFAVEAVPDQDEIKGYVMPLCTRPAVASRFDMTTAFCVRLAAELSWFDKALLPLVPTGSSCSFLTYLSSTASSPESVVGAQLRYAADRCRDLLGMIHAIDEVGCGMMTSEVRCLFETLHVAAKQFPFLVGAHHKNWQLLADVFEKSRVLRYNVVEPVTYVKLDDEVTGAAGSSRSGVNGSVPSIHASSVGDSILGGDEHAAPSSNSTVNEELRILRSRVAICSAELQDARSLLAKLTEQLRVSENSRAQAEELNLVLMTEVRRLLVGTMGGDAQAPYQTLVERLATQDTEEL